MYEGELKKIHGLTVYDAMVEFLTKCHLLINIISSRYTHFFHRCCSAWIPVV